MKLSFYIIVMVSIMIFTTMLLGINTGSNQIINKLNVTNPSFFTLGNFVNVATSEIGVLGAVLGAIAIGTLAVVAPEIAILASFVGLLVLFGADMIGVVSWIGGECPIGSDCRWLYWMIYLIFIPLVIGYIQAILGWWTGRGE